ncbi:hypothetical protein [Micromonospora sp. bgisy143]|uniref:hypothetical protein n=1 Tax=Micromonospora sp. bgisy143 TaxID=3413790 RepID=UPI003EC13298
MALNGPPMWAPFLKDPQPPRADERLSLRQLLLVAAAVSLVIAVGVVAWHPSRLAAPTLVDWQIAVLDGTSDAPPLPDLPADPFAR